MGVYLNPGNSGFMEVLGSKYVDKTGLIGLINNSINTKSKLICVSRPRRFGKSYAAQMLCAYYDRTCDSHFLFSGLEISSDQTYEKHLNQYDVIYIDLTGIKPYADDFKTLIPFLTKNISEEIRESYPDVRLRNDLPGTLVEAVKDSARKFIMIIDEWDAPIRENPETQQEYLEFLRSLFKNSGVTPKVFAAVYMTGILPIKKDGSQSAISDFEEFTMISPRAYANYVGFTENEVRNLCEEKKVNFALMKQWYDGYRFKGTGSVYNPNSVMKAASYNDFASYWTETSAAEGLMKYISMDYNGLSKTIAELIGGIDVPVNTVGFANDLVTFKNRDDVLTLLIHLGYLAYDSENKTAHIPNEEIRLEFQRAIRVVDHEATIKRLMECDQLFLDTIHGNEEAVAKQIEKITHPLKYNREDSLRSVIKLAYYTYKDHYLQIEELPSGDGFADVLYLPITKDYPALLIELKWDKSAEGAIGQILQKHYPSALENYGSDILLVGINYNKDAPVVERKHSCRITKYNMSQA